MPLITRQPTANQTPDPGQGGLAVTGNINTGHSSTNSGASRSSSGSASQTKTCQWNTFLAVSGAIVSINLKFDWAITSGSVIANTSGVGDSATAGVTYTVAYSLDGGSSWTTQVSQFKSVTGLNGTSNNDTLVNSGSENVSVPAATPLSSIRVRDAIAATVSVTNTNAANASAGLNASISNIRLEVVTQDAQQILVMM
jgi:hypothetical protein